MLRCDRCRLTLIPRQCRSHSTCNGEDWVSYPWCPCFWHQEYVARISKWNQSHKVALWTLRWSRFQLIGWPIAIAPHFGRSFRCRSKQTDRPVADMSSSFLKMAHSINVSPVFDCTRSDVLQIFEAPHRNQAIATILQHSISNLFEPLLVIIKRHELSCFHHEQFSEL